MSLSSFRLRMDSLMTSALLLCVYEVHHKIYIIADITILNFMIFPHSTL